MKGSVKAGMILRFVWAGLVAVLMWFYPGAGYSRNTTELMFVGEELKVMTIASGREEGAWSAPAVADVITRHEIEDRGSPTFAELLNFEPGFLMSGCETGKSIHLRGISDSALLLYESIPMGSRLNKNNQINPYISMDSVKRIEIVRGPGSVLWGPDAFAGIVNIVPMTGNDFQGVRTGIRAGSLLKEKEAYLLLGQKKEEHPAFFSLSGGTGRQDSQDHYNLVRFWGTGQTPVPASLRYGHGSLERPGFCEVSGNMAFKDLFRLSAHASYHSRPYRRSDDEQGQLTWKEESKTASGFVKLEGNRKYSLDSGFRWTTFFSWFDTDSRIVDLALSDETRVLFGELVHEAGFFSGSGLLTTGFSIRQETVDNLPVWGRNYYPGYFTDDNQSFLPMVEEHDFNIRTNSVFGQYRQTKGTLDVWAGLRGDDHGYSGLNLSYNTGIAWNPSDPWMFKITYGNAYRTPVAKQIQEGKKDMENIETLSLQVGWRPEKRVRMSVTGYLSRLNDGYVQDPALGLSEPFRQDLYGVELKTGISLAPSLELGLAMSWLNTTGNRTHFRYNDYSYLEGGRVIDHYIDFYEPYNRGAPFIASGTITYRIHPDMVLYAGCRYVSAREGRHLFQVEPRNYKDLWMADADLKMQKFGGSSMDVVLSVRNLLDQQYVQPGAFGPVRGKGLSMGISLEKTW